MDMLMADVTGTDVAPGDEVVIVGTQGAETIDVREMAATIGTLETEVTKSRAYLDRVSQQNQQVVHGSLELDLGR